MIDQAIATLTPLVGVRSACLAVGEPRARHYRRHRQHPAPLQPVRERTPQPRALSAAERQQLRSVLNSDAHVDEAPATVYAKLLDEGSYLGSIATMYRVLREHSEVRERRRQATHPARVKPELVASAPNQVYSSDITKLLGPAKWAYYYLYVIVDIYSRYVPGWMLARAENAQLAKALLAETIERQQIPSGQLTLHADRGSLMVAQPVAFLLASLGVTRSHSRPHTSNDNPYSESQFRTMKYRPAFPDRLKAMRTPVPSAPASSAGTTTNTGTPVSASTPRPTSTTGGPRPSGTTAPPCSPPPTRPIRNASYGNRLSHPRFPSQPGSASRRRTAPRLSDSRDSLPQEG